MRIRSDIFRSDLSGRTAARILLLVTLALVSVLATPKGRTPSPAARSTSLDLPSEISSPQEQDDSEPLASMNTFPEAGSGDLAAATVEASNTAAPVTPNERIGQMPGASEEAVEELPAPILPLVMLDTKGEVPCTPEEAKVWANMQQEFARSFSGPYQDPSSPEYYQRWQEAQTLFDERVHAMFGQEIYSALLTRRVRAALATP